MPSELLQALPPRMGVRWNLRATASRAHVGVDRFELHPRSAFSLFHVWPSGHLLNMFGLLGVYLVLSFFHRAGTFSRSSV